MQELLKENIKTVFSDNILSVHGLNNGDYDKKALFYDKIMSNTLYNLLAWGNHPKNYSKFAEQSYLSSNEGYVVDIGCGSLCFTSQIYNKYLDRSLILTDLSSQMLKIAKSRLSENFSRNTSLLRADALNLPFKDNSVNTILSFGFLHIVTEPIKLITELNRVLKMKGDLHISCLCTDRNISKNYLSFLQKRELVHNSLNSSEILHLINSNGFHARIKVIGGMAYIDAIKK